MDGVVVGTRGFWVVARLEGWAVVVIGQVGEGGSC